MMSQPPPQRRSVLSTLIHSSIYGGSERTTREAPYIRDALGMQRYMGTPILAVTPATLLAIYLFGWRSLALILVAWLVGGIAEIIVASIRKTEVTEGFLVTGILFALLLPPTIPLWVVALGMLIAILVGKELFGGLGHNLFNPALVGVAFLMIVPPFSEMMRTWAQPYWGTFPGGFAQWATSPLDATPLTPLLAYKASQGETVTGWGTLLLGNHAGMTGETCALALWLGGAYLWHSGVIDGRISITILITVAGLTYLLNMVLPQVYPDAIFSLLSGSLLLAAFLNATDPVTSPMTKRGKILYGILIGVLTVIIRGATNYPDGVVFAILIGNAFTPLLDKLGTPKSFGGAPVS
jgi:RnfABCDGE-type electron transport complex D subunit